MLRRGQALLETVLAVLFVSFLFLGLFKLSHMLTGKILLEHAAMRVARARSVGMNAFMCLKTARVAVLPVSGKRLWPQDDDVDWGMEQARVAIYMGTPTEALARGVLEYKGWENLSVEPGDGRDTHVAMELKLFDDDGDDGMSFKLEGNAGVEANSTLYMNDEGR